MFLKKIINLAKIIDNEIVKYGSIQISVKRLGNKQIIYLNKPSKGLFQRKEYFKSNHNIVIFPTMTLSLIR